MNINSLSVYSFTFSQADLEVLKWVIGRAVLYPVIGSGGEAWGCVRRALDWNREKVFHPQGGQEPEQVPQRSGHSMETARVPVWTTLSGKRGILGVVLCRSRRSWTRWSLWFPSNAGHSVILLKCGQLRDPPASSGFAFPQVDMIHMLLYHSFTLLWAALTRADQAQKCLFLSQTLLKPKPTPGAIRVSLERCCALGNTCKAVFDH